MGAPVNPSFRQESFRFRNDDGNQTTATWIAAANTNVTSKPYVIVRLRVLVQQTVSNANTSLARTFKLRYSLNGAAYTDVGAQGVETEPVRMADSPNVADDQATTQQLGTGSFVAGDIEENNSAAITFTSGALSETEIEFVIQLYGGRINNSDTLDFRVYETDNTLLAAYTVTPRLTRRRRLRVLG